MHKNRRREHQVKFWATEDELRLIRRRMQQMRIVSMGAYLRKMAIDGYCITLDMTDIRRLVYLLSMCSNNLNQYARIANTTGCIYGEDIQDLRTRLDEIYENTEQILAALSVIR